MIKRIVCWVAHRWVWWYESFEVTNWDTEGHTRNWYRYIQCQRGGCGLTWSAR